MEIGILFSPQRNNFPFLSPLSLSFFSLHFLYHIYIFLLFSTPELSQETKFKLKFYRHSVPLVRYCYFFLQTSVLQKNRKVFFGEEHQWTEKL